MVELTKYIFMDLDGVCSNYAETPGSYITHKPEEYGMSLSNMERIRNFCIDAGMKIVISSNWRRFSENPSDPQCSWNNKYGKIYNPLPAVKNFFGDLIIDTLPKDRHITKSEALEKWFFETGWDPEKVQYVIFDDDIREGFETSRFSERFILVESEYGVTDADIEKAKWIIEKYGRL